MKRHVTTDRFVRAVGVTGMGFLLFQFLFLWMYTNIDGYFYWAIGHYFKTGVYPFLSPFIYARPITISPPLYGIVLALLGILPHADVLLHAAQLALIGLTAILLFRMLSRVLSSKYAACISFAFLLFPANVIFTHSMMTEIPAQTAMTAFLYFIMKFQETNKPHHLTRSLLLSAGMVLLKYQFIVLYIGVFIAVIWNAKHTIRSRSTAMPLAASILLLVVWISINYAITGVVGLSDTKKMPFYTNAVWSGHLYPSETDPAVLALRKFVPATADPYAEYWDLQDFILPYVDRDWTKIDELLGNVGIAAIKTHPFTYLANGPRTFLSTLTHTAPWWHNVGTFGTSDPVQPLYCNKLDSIQFCDPIISFPWSYKIWNIYISWATLFYNRVIPTIFLVVFLPLLLLSLFYARSSGRLLAWMYLVNLLPLSYVAMPESRYLIPYYPLMILVSVYGFQSATVLICQFSPRKTTTKK